MSRIYVLDAFEPSGLQYLDTHANHEVVHFSESVGRDWTEDAVGIMIRGRRITAEDLARTKHLKVISKQGVGLDNIDLEAAGARGIQVCNTPGINSNAVAELAFALTLAVARRVPEFDRLIRAGEKINRPDYLGVELEGKTVGIIGMGNIGVRAARYFHRGFGCKLLAYDPYASASAWADLPHERLASLEDMWPQLDVLTLHVPLTEETRHIVDAEAISRMKPSAIVINVSRGGLIDEQALHAALATGRLFGAGLDAFAEGEPPGAGNPLVRLPNVVSTPHAGAGTAETQIRSSILTARQLLAVLAGEPPLHRVV